MAERRQRRALDFRDLREVSADAERLLTGGYEKVGNWDLGQVCGHLANWLTYPMDGFPMKRLPWLIRKTMGVWIRNKILKRRSFSPNGYTVKESVPAVGGDPAAEVGRLKVAVDRFEKHAGEFLPSPLFGQMDRETCKQIQLIHCSHHLSFLIPKVG